MHCDTGIWRYITMLEDTPIRRWYKSVGGHGVCVYGVGTSRWQRQEQFICEEKFLVENYLVGKS